MRSLSCLVIGDAAVTVRCAEAIVSAGHELLGVVTADERCAAWAAANSIPIHFSPARVPLGRGALEALARGRACDYLFSIHNVRILSAEVIGFAGRMAINYHDALLPRYAGLHAGSWAIARGETVHGVTWHRVTEKIDDGDILVQRSFALRDDETAWTLGGLCTEAAIESFGELLPRLSLDRVEGTRQELDARSYFYGWMKPAPGCVLPLDGPAETAEAMVRALDFGAADNPIGIAKLLAEGRVYLVSKASMLDSESDAAPGTVLSVGDGSIDVSTASCDVRLWVKPAGTSGPSELSRLAGTTLAGVAPDARWLAEHERKFRRAEAYWASRYVRLAPLVPAELSGATATLESGAEVDLRGFALAGAMGADRAHHALAAVLGWLRQEIGQPFDIAFGETETMRELASRGLETLLVARPPLRVDCARDETLAQFAARLRDERTERRAAGACSIDLPHRLRRLRSAPRLAPAIVVDILDDGGPGGSSRIDPETTSLSIEIAADGTSLTMRSGATDRDGLLRLAQRFPAWLAECEARPGHAMRAVLLPSAARVTPDISVMFRNEVARNPDSIAVESDAGAWSYTELAARVDRLASSLQRRGVAAESLVAIRAARLVDLVTAMLGVLASGGAFVVIDPREPAERAKQILGDAFPDLALGDAALHPLCPEVPFLPIGIADALELPPVATRTFSESDLAYVAFTSGSTGARKGVAIERGSLSRYIEAAGELLGLTQRDRVLQIGSPAFDLAYEQIFGALCHGAALVASDGHDYAGTVDLLARCASRRITVLDPPTNLWSQAARDVSRLALEIPESIRIVVIGGDEALAPDVRAWVSATRGRCRLVNTYGPTETTIVATWWEAPADARSVPDRIPIGQPMKGVEVRVLDADGSAVADGEEGELWIGGFGLARGYHRRPDLTASSFRRISGTRLYRTGDLVRRRADGLLEFLGRIDRQLKIGGRRVEPGEVESVLLASPDVLEAAVSPVTTSDGRKSLAAWVVLRPDADAEDAEDGDAAVAALRAFVVERLPSFLRPSRIERVAGIPRLTGGKVDFETLKKASGGVSASRPELSDPVERALASIFQRLLGSGPVSRDDDFFELGGDSLSAVHLLAEIETTFGTRLPIARLLREATIAALARDLREGSGELPGCVIPLQPDGAAPPLFCVHGLGGHLLRLSTLARELRPDQPFFGLQSPGLDDDQPVPETVVELARLFLQEVTKRIGDETLHLTGMSFGGIVALEMARQAVEQGRRVGLVAMFDTYLTEVLAPPAPLSGAALLRHRLRRAIGDRLGRGKRLLRRTLHGADRIEKANEYRNFTRVLELNDEAMRRYDLGAYDGTVTFFAASQRDRGLFDQFERRIGCRLEVVPVPGDHMTMYDPPHVAELASALRQAMRKQASQARRPAPGGYRQ